MPFFRFFWEHIYRLRRSADRDAHATCGVQRWERRMPCSILPCNTEHGHVSRDRPGAHASMARTVPSVGLCAARECSGTGVPPPSRTSCAALPSRAQSMSDQVTKLVHEHEHGVVPMCKRRYVHLRARPAPGPGPPPRTHRRRCTCIHTRRRAHPQDRNKGRCW